MKFKNKIIKEIKETKILLHNIPTLLVTLFVVSVICMNILANKTLVQNKWIAIDGGILISWLSFLCMDIITKYFGLKASNTISILAAIINLLTCFIFYITSIIPSNANNYDALNSVLGGSWFILLSSTIAFLSSAFINNIINTLINNLLKNKTNNKTTFMVSSYTSTFIGQFLDNFIFSILVFVCFAPIFWNGFHWTILQCLTCAITGAILELILEILFSPIGYKIITKWEENNLGSQYFNLIRKENNYESINHRN